MSGQPRRSTSAPYASSSSQSQPTRYTGAHSNSSAFSPNAQPNEDWTQVSDLAERRRIQNRIAQRNYRKSDLASPCELTSLALDDLKPLTWVVAQVKSSSVGWRNSSTAPFRLPPVPSAVQVARPSTPQAVPPALVGDDAHRSSRRQVVAVISVFSI